MKHCFKCDAHLQMDLFSKSSLWKIAHTDNNQKCIFSIEITILELLTVSYIQFS